MYTCRLKSMRRPGYEATQVVLVYLVKLREGRLVGGEGREEQGEGKDDRKESE